MIERLRLFQLTVFVSWVVFVVAGLAFQRMTEGAPFNAVAADQPAVGGPYLAIVGGAVVSLIMVVLAGVPIALAIARVASAQRQWRPLGLLAVPPVALAVWIGLTLVLIAVGSPPVDGPWRTVAFLTWVGVFVLAAVASTVAVGAAALDADIDDGLYRRATTPAVVVAAAMAIATVAVAAWGIALAIGSPAIFWGSDGILGSSTPLTWLAITIAMAGASAFAVRAAFRARAEVAS